MATLTSKAAWITIGDFSARLLGFITTVYLARVLGSESFGLVTIGLSLLGYGVWFGDLGLNIIGAREQAKTDRLQEFAINAIVSLKLLLGSVVLLLAFTLTWVIDIGYHADTIRLFLLCMIPHMISLEWVFRGREQFRPITISKVLASLTFLGCVIFLVSDEHQVNLVPLAYFTGLCLGSIILIQTLPDKRSLFPITLFFGNMGRLFKKSLALGAGGFFTQVVHLLPPIIIGLLLSVSDAGLYGAAIKVVFIALMLDKIFVTLFLPVFTRYWESSTGDVSEVMSRIIRYMLFGGALLSLMIYSGSEFIIHLLFGDAYSSSVEILAVLSWFIAVTFVNSVFSFGLLAINHDRAYFQATLTGGIISIVLILGFAMFENVVYIAYAVLLSELCITVLMYLKYRKQIPAQIGQPLVYVAGVVIITLLIMNVLGTSSLFSMFGAAFFFISLLLITGNFGKDDIKWIYSQAAQ